jgi:F-type H+-transporting ATPase subunit a
MDIDIFHHFIIKLKGPWGMTNLIIAQIHCLLIFMALIIAIKHSSFFKKFFYFINKMVTDNVKNILGPQNLHHSDFFVGLFLFILISNLYGLLPHAFSFNSHIFITLLWALMVFFYGIFHGLKKPTKFMGNFIPHGAPWPFAFLITPLKIISFLLSPLSLGLRLFVNVLVGHVMLTIFESFGQGPIMAQVPSWIFLIFLTIMELGVSLLQTYIFLISSINIVKNSIK